MDGYTIGVEEEYQLVSPTTGELRSRARQVLAADWSGEMRPESQQTMLEMGTRVCGSAAELQQELERIRLQASTTAEAEELVALTAGIHPFSHWEKQQLSTGERYDRLAEIFGRVIRTEHVFGMHVHVAVPAEVDRARLIDRVRGYAPHLLALSASSPIYEGEDTGYASYRTILWQRLPHAGPPPRLGSEAAARRLVRLLVDTGAVEDEGCIYWNVRAHARYPTVEFRSMDVCPRVDDAAAIAALARALVATTVEGGAEAPAPPEGWSESMLDELLAQNIWQAARHGLDALHVDPRHPTGRVPLREAIAALVDMVRPAAARLGDADALAGIDTILERGNGADRIRSRWRTDPSLPHLVGWLARESMLGLGLDRRQTQRIAG